MHHGSYKTPVEFRVSDELYSSADQLATEHRISLTQFATASIGLLNEAHRRHFSVQRTELIAGEDNYLPLISLRRPPGEFQWPRLIRAALAPSLYDPLAEYAHDNNSRLQERGRQAFRFGSFVLSHVSLLEGDAVNFRHDGKRTEIPFRTDVQK